MIKLITYNRHLVIGIHILIGWLSSIFHGALFLKLFWTLLISFMSIVIIKHKNKNEEALIFASYFTASEVFIRMCNASILWETGKYAVFLFVLIGLFTGTSKIKFSYIFLIYILLLLFGIVLTEVPLDSSLRKSIVFNLSGPILLGICAIYFYQRKITKQQLKNTLFAIILPVVSMIAYLFFKTPSLQDVKFGGAANFATSGGFGPNQVATAIGLGVLTLTICIVSKIKFSGFRILDIALLLYFIYRGLLTFSRGGMIAGFFCIGVFVFFNTLAQKKTFLLFLKYILLSIVSLFFIWMYLSNVTGGMIDNRYTGKNASGVQKEDASSGRIDIIKDQLDNFINHPLGIGVGNGKLDRLFDSDHTGASHNEMGRLVEEHGLIGLLILLLLLTVPLLNLSMSTNYQRAFIGAFYLLWFLTINHSAMRIALPSFIYGLSLIKIVDDEE